MKTHTTKEHVNLLSFQEHTVTLCGVSCSVVTRKACTDNASADTKTLVLLHGWLDNLASFSALFPHLETYNLVALDFIGHGKSDHLPTGMNYHFLDLVYVIQDLVEWLNEDSVTIVGHSMGGAAASLFSATSNKVSHLILLEALGPLTMKPADSLEQMTRALKERKNAENSRLRIFESPQEAIRLRAKYNKLTEQQIAPIVERGLKSVSGGYSWTSDPRLKVSSINRLTEPQVEPLLSNITAPCLLIEAEEGLLTNRDFIQKRKGIFPNLEEYRFSGGHHIHLEQPKLIAEQITRFIE